MVCFSCSEMAGHICFADLHQLSPICQMGFSLWYLVSNRQGVKYSNNRSTFAQHVINEGHSFDTIEEIMNIIH